MPHLVLSLLASVCLAVTAVGGEVITETGRYTANGPTHAFLLTPGTPAQRTTAVSFSGGTSSNNMSGGFGFATKSNIKITDVGVWDDNADGLAGDEGITIR